MKHHKCGEEVKVYSGIIQAILPVVGVHKLPGLTKFKIHFLSHLMSNLVVGSSVSVDGVCFTVTEIDGCHVSFDAMEETLKRTTIGLIKEGDEVNVELSLKMGDEIGGHIVSGHVDAVAKIESVKVSEHNHVIVFSCPKELMKYIPLKGFIALNGASLTVNDPNKEGLFTVYLIPETLKRTTFERKKEGDFVNLEIDRNTQSVVRTVENYLSQNMPLIIDSITRGCP